jgi:hypothetical protein
LVVLISLPAIVQGVEHFTFDFGNNPPPQTTGVPQSGALLSNDLFSVAIYLDHVRPVAGRIVEQDDHGALTAVFSLDNLVFAAYPPPAGATAYSYEQTWQLSEMQIQDLLDGRWFAQVSYRDDSHVGRLTLVPEPRTDALCVAGCFALGANLVRRSRKSKG